MTIEDQSKRALESPVATTAAAGDPAIRPVDFSTGSDVVIRIENLWKQYRLGTINHGTLARDLQSWWARMRGKEDPNQRLDLTAQPGHGVRGEGDDRFWALRDVSFDVKQGDLVGIIGRNGAGKSTLLKILSQVTTPTRGEIKIRGRIASLLEVGTGFHPELTGRENVFLNGAILGMSKAEITKKFDEIVDFSGVEKFIDTPVKRYSSGMYVRLAFAVAAHLEPEILIVDEVLAVGDAQFQKRCLGKMEEVGREGRTVLFVSHNMAAISQLCSRALVFHGGSVAYDGITAEGVDHYFRGTDDGNSGSSPFAEAHLVADLGKEMQIFRVCLKDNEGKVLHKDANHAGSIHVEIEYVIRVPNQNAYVSFCLTDQAGANIWWQYDGDNEVFGHRVKGAFRAKITIPESFLSGGIYYVRPSIVDLSSGGVIDYPGAVFHIKTGDFSSRLSQKGVHWPSRVKYPVTWHTEQLPADDGATRCK